jgi:single-strand DNA-binding protein
MSLNRITLVGRIGKDPQIHELNNNNKVVSFSIQTLEYFTNAQGEQQEISDWHRVSVYIPTWIDYTMRYIKSGDKVMVTAQATTSSRKGTNGQTFTKIGFNVQEITLLEKKNYQASKNPNNGYNNQQQNHQTQHNSSGYSNQQQNRQAQHNSSGYSNQQQNRQAQHNSSGYSNQQQNRPRSFPQKQSALESDGFPKVLDPNCV